MDTSLRRTTDAFETVNRQLESALCSEKYLKTEMWVLIHDTVTCKMFDIL